MASELELQRRQRIRKQFMKTELCRYHTSVAGCRKGTSCEFAHSAKELMRPPNLRRTSICKDWQKGTCPKTADTCKFAHGNALLRRTLDNDAAAAPAHRSMTASSESSSASGSGTRGDLSSAARRFSNWEQQLLRQQEEQEKLKETIREQQKTIDALMRLQHSAAATQGQHPVLPQSGNEIQSSVEQLQQSQNFLQQVPDFMQQANSQIFQTEDPAAGSQMFSVNAALAEQFNSPGFLF
eukprot:TRINITY_DN9331_c0_g2_i2.p1 TRINITY_DN9331_c0_g2~~TRINITY_DN9331_c0_g2_i2.p1  ORF type:complete len:239 (-),score=45.40 TRINITY_DN9331_c0_g2_i2:71-787(-)